MDSTLGDAQFAVLGMKLFITLLFTIPHLPFCRSRDGYLVSLAGCHSGAKPYSFDSSGAYS